MLDGIFNEDNPFFNLMNRVADMVVLNILFVLSCIPVITIGSALTALYYVAINTWSREDGYIFRMYKKSFKENFKQSTILWLILLIAGIILSVDVWYWVSQWKLTGNSVYKPLTVISVILLVLYVLIFTYVWPLQAKFTNTIGGTIKNALAMVIVHVPETIGVWIIFAAIAFSVYMTNIGRVCVLIIGFSLMAYLQALLFRHVFKPYLGESTHKTPEEEAHLVGYENSYAESKIEAAGFSTEREEENVAEEQKVETEPVKEGHNGERHSIKEIIAATSNPEEPNIP